jgi:alpha-amylase
MTSICFYFQVHQPYRVKRYKVFDIGHDDEYFNDTSETDLNNIKVLNKVSEKCYLPANAAFLKLLKDIPEFKISFSFSGVFLEQISLYAPHVLKSFQDLVKTGKVEILSETYYHSLSYFYSLTEFERQVELHKKLVKKLFNVTPQIFRNTELSYTNSLAAWAESKKYKGIIAEGWDSFLGWRSPNFLYQPQGTQNIKLLLKNYKLSDDMAFRFSEKSWKEWPLTASKFAHWINQTNGGGDVVNLFMDYETFGEHQWADTGIFEFIKQMPYEVLKHSDNNFVTTSESIKKYPARDVVDVPHVVTWADTERDLSAWVGNAIQSSALYFIYSLEEKVIKSKNKKFLDDWRKLQTSDHFYYMCTKWFSDGDVHKYFNPYETPYDAFISYMNAAKDLEGRISRKRIKEKELRIKVRKNSIKNNVATV